MTTITSQLTLAPPQVAGPLAVFPVLGSTGNLAYRSFARAIDHGAFVKELDGGASVGSLHLENPTDLALLVYEGEEVLGAQQNRSFDASFLVAAGGRVDVPVSCVEQGRWDGRRHGEHFDSAPHAADPELRRTKRQAVNRHAAAGAIPRADQGEVWREVGSRLRRHAVDSASDSLNDVYEGRRPDLHLLAGAVQPVPGQLGAVATVAGRPVALDLVSRADVFADLLPRLAQGYALEALGAQDAEPDEQAAVAFVGEALHAPRAPQPTPGMGQAFGIVAPGVVGGGLTAGDDLIQLCAFPEERAPEGRIARPARRRRFR